MKPDIRARSITPNGEKVASVSFTKERLYGEEVVTVSGMRLFSIDEDGTRCAWFNIGEVRQLRDYLNELHEQNMLGIPKH